MSKKVSLADFVVKDISFEEKIKIISCWEEDRGSDGENVYDLENDTDVKHWIELYGVIDILPRLKSWDSSAIFAAAVIALAITDLMRLLPKGRCPFLLYF